MEIDKKHIVGKVWVNLCRFLLGALFIFSGFVKAVDPLGFFYKIQDYLTAFDMISWFPSYAPLLVGIALSAIEFSVGVFLFLGIRWILSGNFTLTRVPLLSCWKRSGSTGMVLR